MPSIAMFFAPETRPSPHNATLSYTARLYIACKTLIRIGFAVSSACAVPFQCGRGTTALDDAKISFLLADRMLMHADTADSQG